MSYDIHLDCVLDEPHAEAGGTYACGGTTEPWLNITYNYANHFFRVMERDGTKGVRAIYGMTAIDSIPFLESAITQLGDERHEDYWKSTEGNAKASLLGLQRIAEQAVREGKGHAIWGGD